MSEKKYWKGLEEKHNDPAFVERANKEFAEKLPLVSELAESQHKSGRRDFLKMMGFGLGAATIAASCEQPVRKSIPYVFKPEEITPGMPTYYATTWLRDGDFGHFLVKTREGRPILAEGNPNSELDGPGASSRVQATILSLYDGARIRQPYANGEKTDWASVDKMVGEALNGMKSDRIVLLTPTLASPSSEAAAAAFLAANPNVEHVVYDTDSYDGMLSANAAVFGNREIAAPDFGATDLVVGIGADFLATWLAPGKLAGDYADARRVNKENTDMMRHVQIESVPTVTGSSADTRIPVMPADERLAVLKLYNSVAAKTGGSTIDDGGYTNDKLDAIADELVAARGRASVLCGINDENVQMVVAELNKLLGSYGKTLRWDNAYMIKQGSDQQMASFVNDLNSGAIKGVLVWGCNPLQTHPQAASMAEAWGNLALSVSFAERNDETSAACMYHCPDNHYLESWNDAMPQKGMYGLGQPCIQPLFDTRQWQQSLLSWSGNNTEYYDFIRSNWESAVYPTQSTYSSFSSFWDSAVHDGQAVTGRAASMPAPAAGGNGAMAAAAAAVSAAAEGDMAGAANAAAEAMSAAAPMAAGVSEAASKAAAAAKAMAGDMQLKIYQKVAIGNGYISESPWLQEMPDPVSKICWDNYLLANPKWVSEKGWSPNYKNMEHPVVKLTAGDYSVEVPVVPQPGMPYGAFGLASGYGKTVVNHESLAVGGNAAPFMRMSGNQWDGTNNEISVEATGAGDLLAITQTNYNISGVTLGGDKTRFVVKETTLEDYKNDAWSGNHIMDQRRDKWIEKHLKSPYPDHKMEGHHWGMSIDLTTCTGCGACVTACHAENNVPMVGKYEVRRGHDMHWLRIDRYYIGEEDNPEVVFQPMLCQHCDNAPCENVCPVAATTHSSEGINQMTYNRCIGTRYCANNCPYKVRRFNWYDFQGADSFTGILANEGNPVDGRPFQAAGTTDELTRMVLNPDVTVRSRGVMEKCSFCVQRTQYAKLEAKKEKRALKGDEVNTACESACPTNAIVFGDVNDQESKIHDLVMNDERTFGVIEEIHTLPSVTYLTKVRNTDKVQISEKVRTHSDDHHGAEHAEHADHA